MQPVSTSARRRCTVAVDERVAKPAVRRFGTVTVAMESTGVYWIPSYQVLEARALEVFLGERAALPNVPGRKTDVCAAAWLQFLHAVGLVPGSFRPAGEISSSS